MPNIPLPADVGIKHIEWSLDRPAQINRSAYTGKRTAVTNPWHGLWRARVELAPIVGEAGVRAWRACLAKLKGQINTLLLPATEGPQGSGTIYGNELVTNGTFDTVTTGWTSSNGAILTSVGGHLRVTADGAGSFGPSASQQVATVIGQQYRVQGSSFAGTSPNREVRVGTTNGAFDIARAINSDLDATFTATSSSVWLNLNLNTSGTPSVTAEFDNISLKQVVTKPQLTAGVAQGATSFNLSTNPGLTEGMLMTAILPSGNQQLVVITAIVGSMTTFEPPLREAMATGASVEVTNPTCQVALTDSAFGWSVDPGTLYGISFDVEEVFQ